MLRIWDVCHRSRFFPSRGRITDLRSKSNQKEERNKMSSYRLTKNSSILTLNNCSPVLRNMVWGSQIGAPRSGIRKKLNPDSDPGRTVRYRTRIPNPDPQAIAYKQKNWKFMPFENSCRGYRTVQYWNQCCGSGSGAFLTPGSKIRDR